MTETLMPTKTANTKIARVAMPKCLMQDYTNIVTRTHAELDLTNQQAVTDFFALEKPEYMILAAAKVGGIHANNTYPADLIHENLAIQTNVIHQSYVNGVKRLLFLGSSCIYPHDCPQPFKEEYLLTSELEPTNKPYALAKIAGIEMCWGYNRQHGTKYLAVMPTNLCGPGDNYHPENSHVIPALIRKFHEAKINNQPTVTIWGTGTPKRDFLYSDDMAEACLHLLELPDNKTAALFNENYPPLIKIGSGTDLTIKQLAGLVKTTTGYQGEMIFDISKPDGMMQKLMSCEILKDTGWHANIDLTVGFVNANKDFLLKI